MGEIEQATAAPGEKRVTACPHDELTRDGVIYRCTSCKARFDAIELKRG